MRTETVLTDREADLMEVLWEQGPSTVAEVREKLHDPLAYTTVLTILRTLESKGYVAHYEEGRAHRYRATVGREKARRSALKALAQKLFGGSTTLLLTHLISDEELTANDMRRIRRMLDERSNEDES